MSEDRLPYGAKETTVSEPERFAQWSIVEIMGHQKYIGFVTEEALAGVNMLRVDVPTVEADGEHPAVPAYTKYFGGGSVYSITPVTEELALIAIRRYRKKPIEIYMPELYPPEPPTERRRLVSYPDDEDTDPFGKD